MHYLTLPYLKVNNSSVSLLRHYLLFCASFSNFHHLYARTQAVVVSPPPGWPDQQNCFLTPHVYPLWGIDSHINCTRTLGYTARASGSKCQVGLKSWAIRQSCWKKKTWRKLIVACSDASLMSIGVQRMKIKHKPYSQVEMGGYLSVPSFKTVILDVEIKCFLD